MGEKKYKLLFGAKRIRGKDYRAGDTVMLNERDAHILRNMIEPVKEQRKKPGPKPKAQARQKETEERDEQAKMKTTYGGRKESAEEPEKEA